jgi:hypothetical protein
MMTVRRGILAIREIRETHRNNECDSVGEPHLQRFQILAASWERLSSLVDRDGSIDRNDY